MRHCGYIRTFTGRKFYPLDPRPEDISISDIAHALSMQCRFAGHVQSFYSVAQHSVHVSEICDARDALWGLLHDATEAYLVDVPTPVKKDLSEYAKFEARLHAVIAERFGLPETMPASVKHADTVMLASEARDLFGYPTDLAEFGGQAPVGWKVRGLDPSLAEAWFLRRFEQLGGA